MVQTSRLVLASSSPRRRQLLAEAGYEFSVVSPPIEEPAQWRETVSPAGLAEALAYFKARCVAEIEPAASILGADTVVAAGGRLMGKPDGRRQAERMLGELSGTRHAVITGVALLGPDGWRRIDSDVTYVTMRPMRPAEIGDYLASGEWIGKAGAYAIQETADRFVERIEGSFTNIVGLPIELVGRMVEQIGGPRPDGTPGLAFRGR